MPLKAAAGREQILHSKGTKPGVEGGGRFPLFPRRDLWYNRKKGARGNTGRRGFGVQNSLTAFIEDPSGAFVFPVNAKRVFSMELPALSRGSTDIFIRTAE